LRQRFSRAFRGAHFHRTRLTRGWLSAIGIAPDLVIPHSPQLPPKRSEVISRFAQSPPEWRREGKLRNVSALRSFPLCASFSRSEYYDRTDAYDRHRGMLALAFCRKPPTFTKTDSTRQVGWRLTRRQPTPSKDGFRIEAGWNQVDLLRLQTATIKACGLGDSAAARVKSAEWANRIPEGLRSRQSGNSAQAPNSSAASLTHVYSHVSYTGYYVAGGLLLAG